MRARACAKDAGGGVIEALEEPMVAQKSSQGSNEESRNKVRRKHRSLHGRTHLSLQCSPSQLILITGWPMREQDSERQPIRERYSVFSIHIGLWCNCTVRRV